MRLSHQPAAFISRHCAWALPILFLTAMLLQASFPAWWAQRGATSTNAPDDFAAANIGQLKHIATKAAVEMNETLPPRGTGAGTAINTLVQDWSKTPPPGTRDDFAALKVGQLKYVAQLFHARLIAVKYTTTYPAWLQGPSAADTELANLGQIKTAFAFDLTAPAGQLPPWWQRLYFNGQTGILPFIDSDGDGLSNLSEYILGTGPSVADPDSDHDGLPDALETEFGTDPENPSTGGSGLPDGWLVEKGLDPIASSADADADEGQGDGLTLLEEFEYGTDPNLRDSDNDGVVDGIDGYALTQYLSPPRVPESRYAAIDLHELGLPADAVPVFLDRNGDIFYSPPAETGRQVLRHFDLSTGTNQEIYDITVVTGAMIWSGVGMIWSAMSDAGWVTWSSHRLNSESGVFRWKKGNVIERMNSLIWVCTLRPRPLYGVV